MEKQHGTDVEMEIGVQYRYRHWEWSERIIQIYIHQLFYLAETSFAENGQEGEVWGSDDILLAHVLADLFGV